MAPVQYHQCSTLCMAGSLPQLTQNRRNLKKYTRRWTMEPFTDGWGVWQNTSVKRYNRYNSFHLPFHYAALSYELFTHTLLPVCLTHAWKICGVIASSSSNFHGICSVHTQKPHAQKYTLPAPNKPWWFLIGSALCFEIFASGVKIKHTADERSHFPFFGR